MTRLSVIIIPNTVDCSRWPEQIDIGSGLAALIDMPKRAAELKPIPVIPIEPS